MVKDVLAELHAEQQGERVTLEEGVAVVGGRKVQGPAGHGHRGRAASSS
jgi:hypothetical protein